MRLASVFARDEGGIVKIEVKENSLEIKSEGTKSGKQKNEIEASITGSGLDISFNYKFIEEFINSTEEGSDAIEIKLTDSASAAIFVDLKDPNFLHLIMPIRIQS